MDDEYEKKKEILKDLILREEDILALLQRISRLAKPFLKIEEKTGRIVISSDFPLTNSERIFLFFLGKYLAYHSGITKETTAGMADLSEGLGIVATTLSAPLGRLVNREHVIQRTQKDTYQVDPLRIEATLKAISQRHIPREEPRTAESNSPNPFGNGFGASNIKTETGNE